MTTPPALRPPTLVNGSLPRRLSGFRSPIIWGVLLLVFIEGTVMALLVTSYFYLRLGAETWPPAGVAPPDLGLPSLALGLLVLSPLPVWLGVRALPRGRRGPFLAGLPAGLLLAAAYLALQVRELAAKDYLWSSHAYGSLDWTLGGYGGLHVLVVLLAGGFAWVLGLRGRFGADRYTGPQALLAYWVFAAAASVLLYGARTLSPHW